VAGRLAAVRAVAASASAPDASGSRCPASHARLTDRQLARSALLVQRRLDAFGMDGTARPDARSRTIVVELLAADATRPEVRSLGRQGVFAMFELEEDLVDARRGARLLRRREIIRPGLNAPPRRTYYHLFAGRPELGGRDLDHAGTRVDVDPQFGPLPAPFVRSR